MVMMLHHYNCLLFIIIFPVTDVHMMLKRGKIRRKEGLVNKTLPRKDWASSTHFDKLKKKM